MKGGKDKAEMTENEKQELAADQTSYDHVENVDEEYVKRLKAKQRQAVYLETNEDRLFFSNSCWEIQRANTLQGGNITLNEVVRLRHIGTGKYLAVDEQDRQNLVLHDRANSLDCLFMLRADMAPKKELKYEYDGGDASGAAGPGAGQGQVRSHQRVMIQSWRTENYLQIVEETQSKEEKAFENVVTHINDQFVDPEQQKDSQVRLINHKFQKIEKFRMMFEVEEVDLEKARQAYQSSYIFDEMLEYYAFLNCWAVAPIDMATEAAE